MTELSTRQIPREDERLKEWEAEQKTIGVEVFDGANQAKANMRHIYDQPDPRAYFRELHKLGYAIPGNAKPVFERLIHYLRDGQDRPINVLDLGCSYGVNAALLKHDLSMAELYERWSEPALAEVETAEVVTQDRRFFEELDEENRISVTGFDQAKQAIAFGQEAGLLDHGHAVNLETQPLPESAVAGLAEIDLVTSTGCVGYLTEKSFERFLPAVSSSKPPWMGNFVLRMFPFDRIEATLKEWGYVTEKLPGQTFKQRRFASPEEREQVLDQLSDQGVDPSGQETEGWLLAEFFLSRPPADVRDVSLARLLALQ